MNDDDPLAAHCPRCGFVGRMLSKCEVCGEFIAALLALTDEEEQSPDIRNEDRNG